MSSPPWGYGVCGSSMEPGFDPGRRIEQRLVTKVSSDQLDAERQTAAAVARWQGHAGRPRHCPDRIETGVAGRAEALGGLAGGARGEQHVDLGEEIVEVAAKRLRRLDCLSIGGERQGAAGRQEAFAQSRTQLLAVHFILVGVIARRFELEDT